MQLKINFLYICDRKENQTAKIAGVDKFFINFISFR